MSETVNHPLHYGGDTTYEAIKVIEAWGLGFHLGNAVKYIRRAGHKFQSTRAKVEDLEKARWYLDRLISSLNPDPQGLPRHPYQSTACTHGLHDRCRKTCKFCSAPCMCECHRKPAASDAPAAQSGIDPKEPA